MLSPFRKKESPFQISIGIATFEKRFEDYFVPLMTKIRSFEIDAEIVVAINGEHKREFGEDYRRRMLEFLSTYQKTFPIFFPAFRSLSKLWNTILIHASNEIVLMLNDDTLITDGKFMKKISSILKKNGNRSFLINRSWSHFVARKEEIANLGYFDERLLGIGEEDGDMTWRYIRKHGAPMASHTIRGFKNYAEDTMAQQPENIACHSNSKYSLFNRRFVHEKKYAPSAQGIKGMFDVPMEIKDEGPEQYPSERFYRENLDELQDLSVGMIMITVGIAKDWDWPDLLRQTPGGKGVWEGMRFILDPEPACDFLVVLNNKMETETRAHCPPENVWCLMQEPYMKGHTDWIVEKLECFSRVLTHHAPSGQPKFSVSQPAIPWHVNKTFDQLVALEMPSKPKTLSWVVGNARDLPGHGKRLAFLAYIQRKGSLDIDLFGRAVQFIEDKWDGLAPYKYSLAIENSSSPDYWTEKIADCFLSWSVPIYYGCTNLEDYFPSGSFIRIPIDSPGEAFESVKTIIKRDNWEKRLPALKEARDLVLHRYQLFPHLSRLVQAQPQRDLKPAEVVLSAYRRSKKASLYHLKYKIVKFMKFPFQDS